MFKKMSASSSQDCLIVDGEDYIRKYNFSIEINLNNFLYENLCNNCLLEKKFRFMSFISSIIFKIFYIHLIFSFFDINVN